MNQQEDILNSYEAFQPDTIIETVNATTGKRFANYLIDVIIFLVIYYGLAVIAGIFIAATGNSYEVPENNTLSGNQLFDYLIVYSIYVIFYTFCEGASGGRTIGKLITKTKAVKEDDSTITWKDALIRSLCRVVPFEAFSALGGYPWHDKWTGTKVINL